MQIDPAIIGVLHSEIFVYLMNNKDNRIIRKVVDFLYKAYTLKAGILCLKATSQIITISL